MPKRTSSFQLASLIFGACIMSSLVSCGERHVASGGGNSANPILRVDKVEGKYKVQFTPLNSSVSGYSLVAAKIKINKDQIIVRINAKEAPASTLHAGAIYNAETCPFEIHDLNNDGFIDPLETYKVIGEALIPLDGDLNSQEAGSDLFPYADMMGAYLYEQTGVFSSMLSDLMSADFNPHDNLSKLARGEKLKLEGKVVVIHGVAEETYLPGSIQSIGQLSERVALPIACGKIVRDDAESDTMDL